MTIKQRLIDLLNNRTATVGIVGLGYVGLPLAVEFAEVGFNVIGVDVTAAKVELLNSGVSYIPDISTERLRPLVESGKLRATTDYADLRQADAVSICVPTPLRKTKDPDMSYVIQAVEGTASICHEGMLLVLESTTYPGTTQELIVPRLQQDGFVIGETVFVAFSPERIDPGNKKYGVHNTPKVVGGVTAACTEAASALYGAAVEQVISVSSPAAAEMVKLLENTFRAVNIGLVNEMALMCDKLDVNVWEVIRAASSKPFGFMPFYPGPGLGGHCIPVDPHYLSWKLKALNYTARFIELASEINTSMPEVVVEKVGDALNDECRSVRGSNIVVLGVAYKKDIDDVRESPALDVIGLLRKRGAHVQYHDPYVPKIYLENDQIMQTSMWSEALLKDADCVVIVTDHSNYDWRQVLEHSKLVVDTRNAVGGMSGAARVVTL
ncbi:MAG: nucleotide sugar dehydrogenase [Anaerolineae bacterium]|nr:nucleotide sugar dehydrogenase [Anaerolineae bacterium]NUQ03717.1 nucleotide sugar dehydrogenase [Anaerolineae bacterium]